MKPQQRFPKTVIPGSAIQGGNRPNPNSAAAQKCSPESGYFDPVSVHKNASWSA
jgi:hypothetical protein